MGECGHAFGLGVGVGSDPLQPLTAARTPRVAGDSGRYVGIDSSAAGLSESVQAGPPLRDPRCLLDQQLEGLGRFVCWGGGSRLFAQYIRFDIR